MFRVEPHQLLFIYAGAGVALISVASLLHTARRVRMERNGLRGVVKCGMCAFHFRDAAGMVHPRCPQCGALVERKRHSAL
jgi:hypothetical protein